MANEKTTQNANASMVECVCGIADSFAERYIKNHLCALSQFDDESSDDETEDED